MSLFLHGLQLLCWLWSLCFYYCSFSWWQYSLQRKNNRISSIFYLQMFFFHLIIASLSYLASGWVIHAAAGAQGTQQQHEACAWWSCRGPASTASLTSLILFCWSWACFLYDGHCHSPFIQPPWWWCWRWVWWSWVEDYVCNMASLIL